jgi:glycosyltransferase involved in cell wall biosynthesis
MKLISFAVPCYNSQEYMKTCIATLLSGGDDVEIIIVNDGSKDDTLSIAREYEREYPSIVSVIDKPNGGHGSGVNAGLLHAKGIYYKVVDSDDWLDTNALAKLLDTIKEHQKNGTLPDLYVTNFIYDKPSVNGQYDSSYGNKFREGEIMTWDEVKTFHFSHMMLMHALLYKRKNLLLSGTILPEHTFYVDNLFAYQPLPYMTTVCYLNLDLYHYFIGRADQSVNSANFIKRYEQQIRVMKCMFHAYSWSNIKEFPKGLRKYMWHNLEVILMNTIFFTSAADGPDRRKNLSDMWQEFKTSDRALYRRLRYFSYGVLVNFLPWKLRGFIMQKGYDFLCKKIKLG